jgi:membrane fusion protein, heavy metal efflux system
MALLRWMRRLVIGLVIAMAVTGALVAQQNAAAVAARDTFTGFTRPSLQVTVGSRVEGLVAEVLAEEGQAVGKGDIVLRLDDTIEKIEVELSRLLAEGGKNVEAMELIAKQKQVDLRRGKTLLEKGGITGVEFEQRQLAVKVAELNVEVARNQQRAAKLQHQRDLARLAQRKIKAPLGGVVTRIYKDPGESVERLERVAEIVQLDPLAIVLNVPVATRGRYEAGRAARVRVGTGRQWHTATVKMVDPVVDFASNTYRVKVTLPNAAGKLQAGLRVTVDLSK